MFCKALVQKLKFLALQTKIKEKKVKDQSEENNIIYIHL